MATRKGVRVPRRRRGHLLAHDLGPTDCGSVEGLARFALRQLELDLDLADATPKLIVAVRSTGTAPGVSDQNSASPVAVLGGVMTQVLAFHQAFDLPRLPLPDAHIDRALADLRVRLLREEVEEFADAADACDIVAVADALADIVYVAYGSAVSYGIDLDAVITEVHRANMSKLDEAGRPVLRSDGKVLKAAHYRPPDVVGVLDDQLQLFDPDKARTRHDSLTG